MDPSQTPVSTIIHRLASCSQPSRSRAVRFLCRWLPSQSSVSSSDLLKIWKGLFYCIWHADKAPFQLDLITRLSSLLPSLDPALSLPFLTSFFLTIRREWSGIDLLRLDKFYLLIRKFINQSFALLAKQDWAIEYSNQLIDVLVEKSLLANDKYEANGVNYHIAEVFLDEIVGYLPVRKEIFETLVRPFMMVLERSGNRVLVGKVEKNVYERLAAEGGRFLSGQRDGEAEKLGKYGLVLGLSGRFFEVASGEGTVQGNRKVLFGLRDKFLKLEKEFEKLGLAVSFKEAGKGDAGEEEGDNEEVKVVKKRKKEKKGSDGVEKKNKAKKKDVASDLAAVEESNGEVSALADGEDGGECNGVEAKSKKSKKKKKKIVSSEQLTVESNGLSSEVAAETANGDQTRNDEMLDLDETVILNLQKQFEKAAAEAGMALPITPLKSKVKKKRKLRSQTADELAAVSNGESTAGKSSDKSSKKVRFSMKNNLVWKPQSPMPPQSLRLPPSSTPRGSALKKGVPAGPIKETPPTVKKIKAKGSSVKKARKSLKSISPTVKRLRKLQSLSV